MNLKKSIVPLLITLTVAIVAAISLSDNNSATVIFSKEQHTSINSLITNSMSALEQTKSFDREMERFLRRWELKGASFALMRGDSLIYAKGYGYATDNSRCEVKNIFRIASASKLITATAIMKLVEDGHLTLDDQVFGTEGILNDSLFLELRKPNLKLITVEHLLRHTAGFSSPHGDPAFSNYSIARFLDKPLPLTLDDMVLYATKNNLRYRPGGSYDYSNLGYLILTKIIEEKTGLSYEKYVQDSILHPAGCYDMHIARNFRKHHYPNEVRYYEVKEAEPVEAYDGSGRMTMKSNGGNNVTLLNGAGGWVASSVELLRLVAAINGDPTKPDILRPETIAQMTYDSAHDKPIGWASVHGKDWLRSGSMSGTSALIKRQSNGYTWVFISNYSAWIGPRLSSYISGHVTRALNKVKEWPHRDMFTLNEDK